MSRDGLAPAARRAPRTSGGTSLVVGGTLLIAVALIVGAFALVHSGPAPRHARPSFIGPVMPANFRTANFSLPDQTGRTATLAEYRGKVVVLTFMHSLCHDACPLMAQQIRGAMDQLGPSARHVRALAISVDPHEDTPANVRHFLAAQHMTGRLRYLRGTRAQLAPVWRAYAMHPVGGPVDHTAFVILIDQRGRARVGYPVSDLTPDDLAHDLRLLVRG